MGRGRCYNVFILENIVKRHLPANDDEWEKVCEEYQRHSQERHRRKSTDIQKFWKKCCYGASMNFSDPGLVKRIITEGHISAKRFKNTSSTVTPETTCHSRLCPTSIDNSDSAASANNSLMYVPAYRQALKEDSESLRQMFELSTYIHDNDIRQRIQAQILEFVETTFTTPSEKLTETNADDGYKLIEYDDIPDFVINDIDFEDKQTKYLVDMFTVK